MLEEKIETELKEALKTRDNLKVSTLRMIKAGIANALIAKQKDKLDDSDVIDIISKQIKEHKDSIEQFKKGNRLDLVDKETKELKILESYMPAQLSEDQVSAIVSQAVKDADAKGKQDMGKVMKLVMEKTKGQADGKLVSQKVLEQLSKLCSQNN